MTYNKQNKSVIVVDAYSTGKYLPQQILDRGYNCIHIKSRKNLPEYLISHNKKNNCINEIEFDGNLENLNKALAKFDIAAVMVGTETGVELAEQCARSLNLPGNDPATSHLRRNKFSMIEAVQQAGLLTARQLRASSAEELIHWYLTNFINGETIVIKPLNSAGTDGVTFCSSIDEIHSATQNILGKTNKLGLINEFILGQSFLNGEEFVVNTVSLNGHHHLTDIWQCNKHRVPGAGFVPGCEVLYPYHGPVQEALREYVFKALDALNFIQGPAHFEIMVTQNGPAIIEVGARIQGGVNPDVHLECLGTSQLIKTVDSYLSPEMFMQYYESPYTLKKFSRWVDLIVPNSGKLASFNLLDEVKQLESYYCSNINIKAGDFLEKTIDLYTSPGSIYLINEDPKKLEDDYLKLRKLEKISYQFL